MTDIEVSADGRSSIHHYGEISNPDLDKQIDRALQLMQGDVQKAANLVGAWMQSGQLDSHFVSELVQAYIAKRVKSRSKARK